MTYWDKGYSSYEVTGYYLPTMLHVNIAMGGQIKPAIKKIIGTLRHRDNIMVVLTAFTSGGYEKALKIADIVQNQLTRVHQINEIFFDQIIKSQSIRITLTCTVPID